MSGVRRDDGIHKSKSKYAQKYEQDEEEEEIDFDKDNLFEENENTENSIIKNESKTNIDESNVTNENNHFEKLKIEENIIYNLLAVGDGKTQEEIKINQNELVNALRELDDVSNSSRDSQISVNEGKSIVKIFCRLLSQFCL